MMHSFKRSRKSDAGIQRLCHRPVGGFFFSKCSFQPKSGGGCGALLFVEVYHFEMGVMSGSPVRCPNGLEHCSRRGTQESSK